MTVNEVVKVELRVLEGIHVPVSEMETIGIPLANVVHDLKKCVEFMDAVEQEENRKKAEAAEKPDAIFEDATEEEKQEGSAEDEQQADV